MGSPPLDAKGGAVTRRLTLAAAVMHGPDGGTGRHRTEVVR